MKKLMTAILLTLSVCMVTACSSPNKVDEKAVEEFNNAIKATQKLQSFDAEMKMLLDANDMNMHMKLAYDGSHINKNPIQIKGNVDFAANGFKLEDIAKIYAKDNKVYVNILEEKFYISFEKYLTGLPKDITVKEMEDNLDEFTLKEENGVKTLEGTFNEKYLKETTDYTSNNLKAEITEGVEVDKINSATLKATIHKDGYLENLEFLMNVTYINTSDKDKKVTVPMDIKMTATFKNANKIESITYPDLKDYKEYKGNLNDFGSFTNGIDNIENAV